MCNGTSEFDAIAPSRNDGGNYAAALVPSPNASASRE